nr:serine/threonine protein phosphatase [Desulfobulbaceae bacterium]
MTATYIIGDIHGCNDVLLRLLDKIGPIPADARIVFLGDYIDRGPQSREVVDTVLNIRAEYPHTITLMGNHERMLLDYIAAVKQKAFLHFGGLQTLESYGLTPEDDASEKLPREHLRFFNELLLYWEDDKQIYAHAGIEPGVPMALQSEEWLLWSRDSTDSMTPNSEEKTVVYGHSAFKKPKVGPGKIGIDTGAVYGGHLTCLVLPELEFIQVKGEKFWPVG